MLRLEQVNLFTKLGVQNKDSLPGHPILQDISFEVLSGETVAIVGVSGAGKTHLFRLLNRLSEPTSGKIYLENREYRQIPVLQLRQQVTLLSQEPKLLGMTVRDSLAYGLVLRGLPKQEIAKRTTSWIEQLRIPDDWLGRTEVQLSFGQRQLVSIARALVIEPKVLLLDEPTSALDLGTAERLIKVLTQIASSQQTTIFMINNNLELQQQFATRLLQLHQGRLMLNQTTNQTTSSVNWENLRESLKQAEAEDDGEWGMGSRE
ncbi:MAG: ATP-binding cassette domain-containing protein [Scytonematopsis contorta HA4267-MV1]|jgi:D-methionine transport system ATP-binding protein|nr:ATP-binding cassette domain-containing protein [Scytonematopsis contorta HA4267-MV1]